MGKIEKFQFIDRIELNSEFRIRQFGMEIGISDFEFVEFGSNLVMRFFKSKILISNSQIEIGIRNSYFDFKSVFHIYIYIYIYNNNNII